MFDSNYFQGKNYFEDDGTQNYLVFQPAFRYFKTVVNASKITAWKSKGLSDKSIKLPWTFDNATIRVKSDGNLLKQEKVTFTYNQVANIYIVYEIKLWPFIVGQDFKRGKVLFWAVKLTTNADTGKYKYSGYSIGFDASGSFSLSDDSGFGKTVIIFGADIISSVHIDNKKEDILILCKVQRKS